MIHSSHARQAQKASRLIVLGLVIVAVLLAPGAAKADPAVYYYGWNNLNVNYPLAGCYQAWGWGCATGNFNNWDWSGVAKSSGDCIGIGFRDTTGGFFSGGTIFCSGFNGTEFHITRTGSGAPPYNQPFCRYDPSEGGAASYVKCWSKIV